MSRTEWLKERLNNNNTVVKYFTPQPMVAYQVTRPEAAALKAGDEKWLEDQKAAAKDELRSNRSGASMQTVSNVPEGDTDNAEHTPSEDDNYYPSIELASARPISATVTHLQATLDRLLGHLMANGTIPETAMAVFGAVGLQSVADWMLHAFRFLGVHEKALFAVFNFSLSVAIAGLEYLIRATADLNSDSFKLDQNNQTRIGYYSRVLAQKINLDQVSFNKLPFSLDKLDLMVHTPFPLIRPFTRREALVFTFLIYGMQITNGVFSEYPDYQKSNKFAAGLNAFYKNAFFVFFAQMVLAVVVDKLLFNAIPATVVGVGSELSKIGSGIVSFAGFSYAKVKGCCDKGENQMMVNASENLNYGSDGTILGNTVSA